MKWQEILTTYWGQTTLILAIVTFFIQRLFNLKSKKIEISYSLFQQNRITAVNTFYTNYAKVEFMWHSLSIWDILEHKISSKEMDNIIWPPLNDLKKSVLELKIYFPTQEHKYFQQLLDNFLLINNNLSKNYFDFDQEKKLTHKTNDFNFFKDEMEKKNNKILESISEIIRLSYYHK